MGDSVVTVAGGCFWCIEAVFEELDGVTDVTSGYAGGHVEDPSYEAVCRGETGHAEAVQITYDADRLSYPKILEVFFRAHDPTTLNRQGPDVGSQYRSAIFYHDDDQREIAEPFVADLEETGAYDDPIVTEIEPLETFYEADEHHQDYYENNPENRYCTVTIEPKLAKLRKRFESELRA